MIDWLQNAIDLLNQYRGPLIEATNELWMKSSLTGKIVVTLVSVAFLVCFVCVVCLLDFSRLARLSGIVAVLFLLGAVGLRLLEWTIEMIVTYKLLVIWVLLLVVGLACTLIAGLITTIADRGGGNISIFINPETRIKERSGQARQLVDITSKNYLEQVNDLFINKR